MRLLNPESPLVRAFSYVGNLFLLNLLFLLCALPLVTIGASASALYTVTLKMVRDEEPPLVKGFFEAFRANFGKATGEWLILLLAGFLLWYGTEIMRGHPQDFPFFVTVAYAAIAVLLLLAAAWTFAVQASYENTVFRTIGNALALAVTHPLSALLATALTWAPVALLVFAPYFAILSSVFWFLFGFSGIALINSHLFRRCFESIRKDKEETQ